MSWPTGVASDAELSILKNNLASTLNGAIDAVTTTVVLTDASAFPTAGYVTIDTEAIKYTGKSTNTLTGVTRGADSTTAATHSNGAAVLHLYVAAHHNTLKDEIKAIETSLDLTASRALVSSAGGRVEVAATTATQVGYLSTVSSNVQTQLDAKEPTITTLTVAKGGTNSGTALSNNRVMTSQSGAIKEASAITASRALISDSNGIPTHSTVTSTTLAFLDATSSVQTQLGTKLANDLGLCRNRLINGDMRIDQRNAGAAVTINSTSNTYGLDRWFGKGEAADGVFTLTQETSTIPTGHTHALKVTVTTADASIGSSQYYSVGQSIEGLSIPDFLLGTASARTVTLSFWVRSSVTGTFSGVFQNSAANRSYPFTYVINSANTYEQKTVTVALDTTGTWLVTNGIGLKVLFDMGSGSTVRGTASAWAGSDYRGVTSATSLISTNAATWYLSGVQLEIGSAATGFEYRLLALEHPLAKRYYQLVRTANGDNGASANTKEYHSAANFLVEMRAAPTVTYTSVTATQVTSRTALNITTYGFTHKTVASGPGTMLDESIAACAAEI